MLAHHQTYDEIAGTVTDHSLQLTWRLPASIPEPAMVEPAGDGEWVVICHSRRLSPRRILGDLSVRDTEIVVGRYSTREAAHAAHRKFMRRGTLDRPKSDGVPLNHSAWNSVRVLGPVGYYVQYLHAHEWRRKHAAARELGTR